MPGDSSTALRKPKRVAVSKQRNAYGFVVVVVDRVLFFSTATASGLEGSAGLTSTLLLVDESVVVLGGFCAGAAAVAGTGAAADGAGVCSQPASVKPSAVTAHAAKYLNEWGFICEILFLDPDHGESPVLVADCWPFADSAALRETLNRECLVLMHFENA